MSFEGRLKILAVSSFTKKFEPALSRIGSPAALRLAGLRYPLGLPVGRQAFGLALVFSAITELMRAIFLFIVPIKSGQVKRKPTLPILAEKYLKQKCRL